MGCTHSHEDNLTKGERMAHTRFRGGGWDSTSSRTGAMTRIGWQDKGPVQTPC